MSVLAIDKSGKLKLSEKQITEQCISLLRAAGWHCIRLQSGVLRGRARTYVTVGETGQPDWICTRVFGLTTLCEVAFLELKKRTGKTSDGQDIWHSWAKAKGYDIRVVRGIEDVKDLV